MKNKYAPHAMSRRAVILGATGASLAACATVPHSDTEIASIESRLGGRVGVAAFDVSTGRTISHHADERFAMCSTFKWALAALVLREQEAGRLSIHRPLLINRNDLVPYAPVVEKRIASGSMTIAELCAAATGLSDNAAANILLRLVGGPEGFTASLRALGDQTTRLDRWETDLNENAPGDPRDTTTPSAMIALLRTFLIGDALNAASKERLAAWMIASKTGADRLRAGLPQGWTVGDKTGTSGNGAYNDIAFAVPDGRAPIFIACYVNAPTANGADANVAHAAVARRIAAEFA